MLTIDKTISNKTNKSTKQNIIKKVSNFFQFTVTLEQKIKKIKALENTMAESVWHIGKELIEIKNKKLYEQQNYKSFTKFMKAELSYTKRTAYAFIKIATYYKDPDEVNKIGWRKAELLLNAPGDQREELMQQLHPEDGSKGMTFKLLQKKIGELNGNKKKRIYKKSYISMKDKKGYKFNGRLENNQSMIPINDDYGIEIKINEDCVNLEIVELE